MHVYSSIRKLNPNINLKYEILSCLKFPSLRYVYNLVVQYVNSTIDYASVGRAPEAYGSWFVCVCVYLYVCNSCFSETATS